MPTWLTPLLAPIASCLAPLLNWFAGRSAAKNTPVMVNTDIAKKEQAQEDKDTAFWEKAKAGDKDAETELRNRIS